MFLQTPLFNIHDIALILVVFQSLLLAALLLTLREGKRLSNRLLAMFIVSVGVEALDTLLYWCAPLKALYLEDTPELFFLLKFMPLIQGPLLYFYVKSLIYTDFKPRRSDGWHWLPALLIPLYTALILLDLGRDQLQAGVHHYAIYWDNRFFRTFVLAQSVCVLGYSLVSLRLMSGYEKSLRENFSNLDHIERRWLKLLILGFSFICFWNLTSYGFSTIFSVSITSFLGLGGNYLDLLFINLLVFYNLLYSHLVQGIRDPEQTPAEPPKLEALTEEPIQEERKDEFSPDHIQAIEKAILEEQVYLTHDLTLEQLAVQAGMSARTASSIINRHFQMSFFDFVNFYRVEAAKRLLTQEPDKSVLEISELAGFNSKSAFNRFFKKFAGVTPTEYRKDASAQNPANA